MKKSWQMKRRTGVKLLLVSCLAALASPAMADVRLPAIVGDNMMLQQQMRAPIWGWANPGETVTVAGSWGKEASATADDNGKWKVCLDTPSYDGPLDAFAVAGPDQQFVWADATIEGDTVVVSSPNISEPAAVRYAWAMNPSQRNLLYNREGIPASPFRTDTWPLFDPDNYDPPVQPKPEKPDGYEQRPRQIPTMTQ